MVTFLDNIPLPYSLASIRTLDGKSPKEATDHNQRVKKNNSRATAERTDCVYMLQTATVAMFCCKAQVTGTITVRGREGAECKNVRQAIA